MAILPLKLDNPNRNVDPTSLTTNLEYIKDGYRDEAGAIKRRPAYELFVDLGVNTAIDGEFWWSINGITIVVSGGSVYKITDNTGAFSPIPGDSLLTGIEVKFTELYNGATPLLFMANGTRIAYTDGNTVTYIADGNCPTEVSHIAEFNTFLIAVIKGTNSFAFSNANAPLTWTITDTYDCEVSTDIIETVFVSGGRLYFLGKRSIETWYNSGQAGDPFIRRLSSSYVQDGIYSPYTISELDGRLVFLNKKRRIVQIEGDQSTILSQAYDAEFQSIEYANDAYSMNMSIDGSDFFVTSFKSADRTLIYDYALGQWYEWSSTIGGERTRFIANCYTYAQDWNMHLIGDRLDGKIYKMSSSLYSDNGSAIHTLIRTGHINHGDDFSIKNSLGLLLRIKRGTGLTGNEYTAPTIRIRWRDDGKPDFTGWKEVSLGAIGDTGFDVHLNRNRGGRYRTRQYEIEMSENAGLVLSGAWEKVTGNA